MAVDLDEIKARVAAATPGPWRKREECVWAGDEAVATVRTNATADAALIAHAPADLAALVAEVERLRASCDCLEIEARGLVALHEGALKRAETAEAALADVEQDRASWKEEAICARRRINKDGCAPIQCVHETALVAADALTAAIKDKVCSYFCAPSPRVEAALAAYNTAAQRAWRARGRAM